MTLESLRQCFVDREMRIEMPLPGASAVTADAVAFPHIKHVKVSGGFLGDLELALHHGLTTVLGAKGSAKSLFVELLRFALNQEPEQTDIRRDHDSKLVERLGVYESVSVTFVDASGHEHMVERKLDPVSGNPYTSQAADPAVHFPCHFLSQGEVVRIAESPDEQLTFIDSFFDFRSRQARIDGLRDSLGQLDAQVAAHIAARKQLKVLQVQEKSLDAEIGEKDKQLKSPIFERFRSAQAKNQAVQQVIDAADRHRLYLQDVWEATKAMSVPVSALAEDPVIARVTQVLSKQLVSSEGFVRQAVAAAEQAAAEIEAERDKWRPQFETVSLEHAEELRKVGGSSAALSQERARLVKQREGVTREIGSLKERAAQLHPKWKHREELLAQLKQEQSAYFAERRDRCDWFGKQSEGKILAEVEEGSNKEAFEGQLQEMKRGSYLSAEEVRVVAAALTPEEFTRAILRYDVNGDQDEPGKLARATGLREEKVHKLIDHIVTEVGYARLLEMEYSATPTDTPSISLLVDGQHVPLHRLSVGQKSTALLIMALCEGNQPIIVDQPEDSLDIRTIWDDMCSRLRAVKRQRQFLFTTHNSSLAVASDSDKFVVFTADAKHASVEFAGAIDSEPVRNAVIDLLEGGPETYFLKQRKYNIREVVSGDTA